MLWREDRAVDTFEPAAAIDGVQTLTGPDGARLDGRNRTLTKARGVERIDPHDNNTPAIAFRAVLNRTQQHPAASDHSARRPREARIDERRPQRVLLPRAEEVSGVMYRQRVGVAADSLACDGRHPIAIAMMKNRRVAGLDALEQLRDAFPAMREFNAAIKSDRAGERRFRQHIEFAVVLDQMRIGEMPGFFQSKDGLADRPARVERAEADDALVRAIVQ